MKHTVVHIHGKTGSGKTLFLERLNKRIGDVISIVQPDRHGDHFPAIRFTHEGQAAIAIDEMAMWERESVKKAVRELEDAATMLEKTLILVTQGRNELNELGIQLKTKPFVIDFNSDEARRSFPGI